MHCSVNIISLRFVIQCSFSRIIFQSPNEGSDEERATTGLFFGAPQSSVSREQIEREQRMLEERLRAQQIEVKSSAIIFGFWHSKYALY